MILGGGAPTQKTQRSVKSGGAPFTKDTRIFEKWGGTSTRCPPASYPPVLYIYSRSRTTSSLTISPLQIRCKLRISCCDSLFLELKTRVRGELWENNELFSYVKKFGGRVPPTFLCRQHELALAGCPTFLLKVPIFQLDRLIPSCATLFANLLYGETLSLPTKFSLVLNTIFCTQKFEFRLFSYVSNSTHINILDSQLLASTK